MTNLPMPTNATPLRLHETTTPRQIGRYEILHLIGRGGTGEVLAARDSLLGRKVAIKVLRMQDVAADEAFTRLKREAQAASILNHPNIVTVYALDFEGATPYLAMEYVEGEQLRARIDSGLSLRAALDIAIQIAQALAAAHEKGLVHRDLKPENIMITGTGSVVKLLDFGLATLQEPLCAAGEGSGRNQGLCGTISYMSPEQAIGDAVDFRSDIFSFGVVLYEMLTSQRAFEKHSILETIEAIAHERPEPLSRLCPEAPKKLVKVISRCLAKRAGDRYSSTEELVHDLREVRKSLDPCQSTDSIQRSASGWNRRSMVAPLLLSLALIGAGLKALPAGAPSDQTPARDRILVAAFHDLGGDGKSFVQGLDESVRSELASQRGAEVITAAYGAEDEARLRTHARDAGATLVLRGTAQRFGERVRIAWTLVDARTGAEVDGDTVNGVSTDMLALQDRVTESIGGAVGKVGK